MRKMKKWKLIVITAILCMTVGMQALASEVPTEVTEPVENEPTENTGQSETPADNGETKIVTNLPSYDGDFTTTGTININGTAVCDDGNVEISGSGNWGGVQNYYTKSPNSISQEEAQELVNFASFEMSIKWELDKQEALSNGDKVKLTITYNEDSAKEQKIKIKGDTTKEFEVSGLKEPITLDAFDPEIFDTDTGVKISYEGISPMASIVIENGCGDGQAQRFVEYVPDKTYEISNGDTITITASLTEQAIKEGYVLKEEQTQITVEGLESYVLNLSELNEGDRNNVETKLNDLFKDTTSDWISFLVEDQDISLSPDSGCSYGDIKFLNEESKFYKDRQALVIPFTVDIKDAKFNWWGTDYYEEPLVKSFNDVAGYFTIYNLKTTASGEVIDDEMTSEISALYANKEELDREIRESFE